MIPTISLVSICHHTKMLHSYVLYLLSIHLCDYFNLLVSKFKHILTMLPFYFPTLLPTTFTVFDVVFYIFLFCISLNYVDCGIQVIFLLFVF